jgi:hypothetical protein
MSVAIATAGTFPNSECSPRAFPLNYEVRNETPSRLATLLRFPLALPWGIVNVGITAILFAITLVAWFAVVVAGRYPKPLWQLSARLLHWSANYHGYYYLLTDRYAIFEFGPRAGSPTHFEVSYPENSSRMIALFRGILLLPGYIVFLAISFTAMLLLPVFWVAILLTGERPQWLFNFMEGTGRWYLRLYAYLLLLRDEYPPYSMDKNAPVSSNVTAFIMGITFIGVLAAVGSQFGNSGRGNDDDDWWPESSTDAIDDDDAAGEQMGTA